MKCVSPDLKISSTLTGGAEVSQSRTDTGTAIAYKEVDVNMSDCRVRHMTFGYGQL